MSGHSHAKTVQHTKEAAAKKRGKIFSKLSRVISVAAKNGGDPDMNSTLRMAIEQARKANMPQENIERAIKKGTGELEGENLEEFCFEAYGPNKSALIICGITNNNRRTLSEIKQILIHDNAKLAEEGSVKWQFDNMGEIVIEAENKNKEKIEMLAIECGAEDLKWTDNVLMVYVKPENLEATKQKIVEKGLEVSSTALGWKAKKIIVLDEKGKDKMNKIFEDLDENDDVQKIYSNTEVFLS